MLAKFEHTQGLSMVSFNKTITVFCPLGNDYYTAVIRVDFVPNEWMMDYLDEERFFKDLQGSKYIIEDIAKIVYDHLVGSYGPKHVKVTVDAYNATHFPVTVVKETQA